MKNSDMSLDRLLQGRSPLPPLDHPLWQYSLRVYQRPGVSAVCLQLQDNFGVNVNLLLAAAWAAEQGRSLCQQDFVRLAEAIAPLSTTTTQPIRQFRRQMLQTAALPSDWHSELKHRLLQAELYAEQLEQAVIYQTLLDAPAMTDSEPSSADLPANANLLGKNLLACAIAAQTPATAALTEALSQLTQYLR